MEKKVSEQILDMAIEMEENGAKGVDMLEIKRKIDILIDYAIRVEEYEKANEIYNKYTQENNLEINQVLDKVKEIAKEGREKPKGLHVPTAEDLADSKRGTEGSQLPTSENGKPKFVFDDMDLPAKKEAQDTIKGHLAAALEILIGKGKERKKEITEKSKQIIEETSEKIAKMYDASIDFVKEKKEENKERIAANKEEKKRLKQEAIEQLKKLGKFDEVIEAFEDKKDEIEMELDDLHEDKKELKEKKKSIDKNTKAIVKYKKQNFFNRFISNFNALDARIEMSEEQEMDLIENGGVPKKKGFFSRVKQAFAKTREQDIVGENIEIEEGMLQKQEKIMQKFEAEMENLNSKIAERENLIAENDQEKDKFEKEKKEKLVEIVKMGNLKASDLKEAVENEIELCSNPHLIIAQAKASSLAEKLSRIVEWGKEKVADITKKESPRGVAELNKDSAEMDMEK